jgi:hypothetical protein
MKKSVVFFLVIVLFGLVFHICFSVADDTPALDVEEGIESGSASSASTTEQEKKIDAELKKTQPDINTINGVIFQNGQLTPAGQNYIKDPLKRAKLENLFPSGQAPGQQYEQLGNQLAIQNLKEKGLSTDASQSELQFMQAPGRDGSGFIYVKGTDAKINLDSLESLNGVTISVDKDSQKKAKGLFFNDPASGQSFSVGGGDVSVQLEKGTYTIQKARNYGSTPPSVPQYSAPLPEPSSSSSSTAASAAQASSTAATTAPEDTKGNTAQGNPAQASPSTAAPQPPPVNNAEMAQLVMPERIREYTLRAPEPPQPETGLWQTVDSDVDTGQASGTGAQTDDTGSGSAAGNIASPGGAGQSVVDGMDSVEILPYAANANPQSYPSISFSGSTIDVRMPGDNTFTLRIGGNTFTSSPSIPNYASAAFLNSSLNDAENGDLRNVDLALLWLKSSNGSQVAIDYLSQLTLQYPDANRLFSNSSLISLGKSLVDSINKDLSAKNYSLIDYSMSYLSLQGEMQAYHALEDGRAFGKVENLTDDDLIALGYTYLDVMAKEVAENNDAMLNNAASLVSGDNNALAGLNTLTITQQSAVSFRTYSGVIVDSVLNAYTAYNPLVISSSKRIIVIHSGSITESKYLIIGDNATMFWDLYGESANGTATEENNIFAHNIVKGKFIAYKDGNDDVYEVILMAPLLETAKLYNDDAEIYMRSEASDAIHVKYDGINITTISVNSSFDGSGIKEVYFGKKLPDSTREHYVRGSAWTLYFADLPFQSGGFKQDLYEISKGRAVLNVTLQSKDSLYRFLPQDYSIATSEHGNFEEKVICFVNCENQTLMNMVYLREDEIGLLSIGIIGNTIVEYEGNIREVFDPNYAMLIKADFDEYASDFNFIHNSQITKKQEPELLSKLNNEAKRDMSILQSLEQQKLLYYQTAKPASYTNLNDKVNYIQGTNQGYITINLFSYIVDSRRKLVLNSQSYDNAIDLNDVAYINIPVETDVTIDSTIAYTLESDLSLSPEVYSNKIYFISPSDARNKYGTVIS